MRYYAATGDSEFLAHAVPILNSEYEFWMSNTSVVPAPGYVLNRYPFLFYFMLFFVLDYFCFVFFFVFLLFCFFVFFFFLLFCFLFFLFFLFFGFLVFWFFFLVFLLIY
jgi:hypothetical protein